MKNITHRSLAQIEENWKFEIPREGYSSSIQLRSYKLYNRRIADYSVDDIRFMIGQEIGAEYLIPIAFNYLRDDLLLDACYYEGDLLNSILSLPEVFWKENPSLYRELYNILLSNNDVLEKLDLSFETDRRIKKSVKNFVENYSLSTE